MPLRFGPARNSVAGRAGGIRPADDTSYGPDGSGRDCAANGRRDERAEVTEGGPERSECRLPGYFGMLVPAT